MIQLAHSPASSGRSLDLPLSWSGTVYQPPSGTPYTEIHEPAEFRTPYTEIRDLGEPGYRIRRPIAVQVRKLDERDFEARAVGLNVAIGGRSAAKAIAALRCELLDTFDVLMDEEVLGPDAETQFRILRSYIERG